MAAPYARAYNVGSGMPINAGRYANGAMAGAIQLDDLAPAGAWGVNASTLAGAAVLGDASPGGALLGYYMPGWRANMAPGTWKKVPIGNTLDAVDPDLDPTVNPNYPGTGPWHGSTGHRSVLDAWCSLTPSQTDGRIYAPLGGGHADYGGNESYYVDLMAEVPAWVRFNKPSGYLGSGVTLADGLQDTGVYSDGMPRGIHSYYRSIHVPGQGIFVASLPGPWPGDKNPNKAFWLNTTTGAWSLANDYTALADSAGHGEGGCCHDTARNVIWSINNESTIGSKILKYDIATGVMTTHGPKDAYVGGYSRFIYVPGHDLVVNITGSGGYFMLWNPATETWRKGVTVTGSMSSGFFDSLRLGAGQWVPSLGGIVFWNNDTALAEITILKPPATGSAWTGTWTLSTIPVDPSNTVLPSARPGGTDGISNVIGKFGYLPALKGCFLQCGYYYDMYFFALE